MKTVPRKLFQAQVFRLSFLFMFSVAFLGVKASTKDVLTTFPKEECKLLSRVITLETSIELSSIEFNLTSRVVEMRNLGFSNKFKRLSKFQFLFKAKCSKALNGLMGFSGHEHNISNHSLSFFLTLRI